MRSEQEELARLVGTGEAPDLEEYTEMLAQGLMERVGKVSPELVAKMQQEQDPDDTVARTNRLSTPSRMIDSKQISIEKVLVNLYEARDRAVILFESQHMDSESIDGLTDIINTLDICIKVCGGEIETFMPMQHLSGLGAPDIVKNAKKVIETTMQCYRFGRIESAKLSDDGGEIAIIFSGNNKGVEYQCKGTIQSRAWSGNEAIDYIYNPDGGEMSVKAFEQGRWVDTRKTGNYKLYWELEEKDNESKIDEQVEDQQEMNNDDVDDSIKDE